MSQACSRPCGNAKSNSRGKSCGLLSLEVVDEIGSKARYEQVQYIDRPMLRDHMRIQIHSQVARKYDNLERPTT